MMECDIQKTSNPPLLTLHLHSSETYFRSDIFCLVASVSTSNFAGFDSPFIIDEAKQLMIALKMYH